MKNHTTLKSKFNSAFSLVELLVVIAVIAVIAAIAIPNIAGTIGQAERQTQIKNAQTLVNTYNAYVGAWQLAGSNINDLPDATVAAALTVLTNNSGVGTRVGTSQPFGIGVLSTNDLALDVIVEPDAGIKTLTYNAPAQ
jgi:prepilin-type N-terminal cleavage/methylation domain-containing protein